MLSNDAVIPNIDLETVLGSLTFARYYGISFRSNYFYFNGESIAWLAPRYKDSFLGWFIASDLLDIGIYQWVIDNSRLDRTAYFFSSAIKVSSPFSL